MDVNFETYRQGNTSRCLVVRAVEVLDDRGVVVMMCDEKLEPTSAKAMVKGQADRLNSAFHLGGYNMIFEPYESGGD